MHNVERNREKVKATLNKYAQNYAIKSLLNTFACNHFIKQNKGHQLLKHHCPDLLLEHLWHSSVPEIQI